jgi:hypothetical protein
VALKLEPAPARARSRLGAATRWLVAAVVGIALLAGAFVLGRVTVPGTAAPPAPAQTAGEETVVAEPAPDAADPAPAPPAPADPGPGPYQVVDDIPVGFARTQAGAVAAATEYVSTIGDKRAFNREWRERAYRTISDPAVADELLASVEQSYERVDGELGLGDAAAYDGSVLAVTVPVGYRVDAFDQDRATVTVWAAGWLTRLTGRQLPLRAQTSTMELVWLDGDWKLTEVTGIEPLDPPGIAAPVDAQTLAEMRGFNAYEYRPQEPR